ncbi:DnaJ domain [Geosmithia morbida]|uniref:DnaJ domain n=1 Tax=Geosmithia morbida TaxID=1094350 RepID=A0A9P4YYX6_9HYPO|nr:DnaJ domain [Geosmithia morbida]KAF4123569.1 DnaJ domain [Geosmithia morbida]
MKVSYLSIGLLALLSPLTAAWSKEDREIFRIRDEITAHESDPSSTFYDILGVGRSASHDEITKAYRLRSRSLHPDKVKQSMLKDAKNAAAGAGDDAAAAKKKKPSQAAINAAVKKASEAQARLSLIANILRSPERDRYDYFLANGFPLWKGTDYYYNRYRPGLGTAVAGVVLLCGGAIHYLVLYMSWRRQSEFVDRYIKFARDSAWGSGMIPGIAEEPEPTTPPAAADGDNDNENTPAQPMNRRQRRMQEKETKRDDGRKKTRKAAKLAPPAPGTQVARKRVVAENGKILVVDSLGNVYLEDQDDEGNTNEFLLDVSFHLHCSNLSLLPTSIVSKDTQTDQRPHKTNELPRPTLADTAIVRVPMWAVRSTFGRLFSSGASSDTVEGIVVDEAEQEAEQQEGGQRSPGSDSASSDFEILDKSTDSLNKAKTSGAQQGGKPNKRKGKKR